MCPPISAKFDQPSSSKVLETAPLNKLINLPIPDKRQKLDLYLPYMGQKAETFGVLHDDNQKLSG